MTKDKLAKKLLLESMKLTSTFKYGFVDGYWRFAGICPACHGDHEDHDCMTSIDTDGAIFVHCPTTDARVYGI